MADMETDILIIGGGTGGVAAALAAAERGARCIVTEPTEWIGGQLTSQAVPPDENQWVESFGGTARYQSFRERVRGWYRAHTHLTPEAADNRHLNPGGGWVSRLCVSPRIAHEVLREMLAPHVASGRVQIVTGCTPIRADVDGDRIRGVEFRSCGPTGVLTFAVSAPWVLDATELGDVYVLAGVEHSVGAEAANDHGEMHGRPDFADPMDQQAFSWCFALENRKGEDHTISRPGRYDFWRNYVPQMTPAWCGRLFSWTVPSHNDAGCRTFPFHPWPEVCPANVWDMWRYRRIVDASIHTPGKGQDHPDVCLVNWVQMDYWLKPLLNVPGDVAAAALVEAREQSLCLLYWLQTEAPHADGKGAGFPGLRLRGDELGTKDGFAMAPYIREPRRLQARTIVHEGHIGVEQRKAEGRAGMDVSPLGVGERFEDSVGIGHYTLDLHPSTAGRNSVYVPATPFRIPLGSLIPVRVRNLVAAGKGIGVTHVTNGCYRMHAVEWNVGESAGHLAAWCLSKGLEPAQVHESRERTKEFQADLTAAGVRLSWPWEK